MDNRREFSGGRAERAALAWLESLGGSIARGPGRGGNQWSRVIPLGPG